MSSTKKKKKSKVKTTKIEVGDVEGMTWHGPNECKHKWIWLSDARPNKKSPHSTLAPTKWCTGCGGLNQLVTYAHVKKVFKHTKKFTGRKWKKVLPYWGYGIGTIEVTWTEDDK